MKQNENRKPSRAPKKQRKLANQLLRDFRAKKDSVVQKSYRAKFNHVNHFYLKFLLQIREKVQRELGEVKMNQCLRKRKKSKQFAKHC